MAFSREFIRSLAKECGVEIPKEFEDGLVSEHITARDAYAETQVKNYKSEHKPEDPTPVQETDEYKTLKQQFDDYKTETEAKATKSAKEKAYKAVLKEAGVSEKRIDSILRVTDLEGVKLDKDGEIKDRSELVKNAKTEWADFIVSSGKKGATPATPPATDPGRKTKEQIMAIPDRAQRRKEIAENLDLFENQ